MCAAHLLTRRVLEALRSPPGREAPPGGPLPLARICSHANANAAGHHGRRKVSEVLEILEEVGIVSLRHRPPPSTAVHTARLVRADREWRGGGGAAAPAGVP